MGVVADVDDENVVPGPALTVYHPFEQLSIWGGRLFIHAHGDLYALVTPVTRIIRAMSPETPVERAATLEDIRTEVLTPDRLNTLVFGGFAAVALAIAVVGVAGVLAFSVSAANARIRHPAGRRGRAAASGRGCDRRRRRDRRGGRRGGRNVRIRAGEDRGQLL